MHRGDPRLRDSYTLDPKPSSLCTGETRQGSARPSLSAEQVRLLNRWGVCVCVSVLGGGGGRVCVCEVRLLSRWGVSVWECGASLSAEDRLWCVWGGGTVSPQRAGPDVRGGGLGGGSLSTEGRPWCEGVCGGVQPLRRGQALVPRMPMQWSPTHHASDPPLCPPPPPPHTHTPPTLPPVAAWCFSAPPPTPQTCSWACCPPRLSAAWSSHRPPHWLACRWEF